MTEINKIKRAALVLFGVVSLICVGFLFWLIRTHASGWMLEMNLVAIAATVLGGLFVVVSLGISLTLLHTIRKEETPFTKKIVRKLKTLATLLIVFEPLNFALDLIPQLYEPIFIHYSPVEGTDYYVVSASYSPQGLLSIVLP